METLGSAFIGSVDGTYCEDQIFSDSRETYGKFQREDEFYEGPIKTMYEYHRNSWPPTVAGFVRVLPPREMVLTYR